MPPIRPPGTGRKARAKRRREQDKDDAHLLHAPWLHGNTRPGRLAKLDMACQYLELPMFASNPKKSAEAWPWRRSQQQSADASCSGIAVDIGIGDDPCTTLELAACLAKAKDDETFGCLRLIGTDLDENRLVYARSLVGNNNNDTLIDFCQAKGFDLSALQQKNKQPLLLIRAMNVLRDYHIHDASKALYQLHDQLYMGGVLVEGSCSPSGHLSVVIVICKQQQQSQGEKNEALVIHAVIFAAKLDEMEDDELLDTSSPAVWFQRHLPRIWRQSCRHDDEGSNSVHSPKADTTMPWASNVWEFLYDWDTSYSQSVVDVNTPTTKKPRQRFLESVTALVDQRRNGTLGEKGPIRDVIMDDWVEEGVLVWKPSKEFPLAVPRSEQTLPRHADGQQRHDDDV
jgi:hypothetical protein